MSINLVTYANQTVTPTNDAIIYEKAVDQNGIFYGCNITVSGNNVNITGGYGIVCGREFVIESESIPVTLAPSVPLDGRLYVRLDLADADNPIQLLTAQGGTLPALEQDANVNFVNGVWEMELATFTVGVSSLSNVNMTYETIVGSKLAQKVDFVIEQGTSGDWIYRKWNSGRLELHCSFTETLTLNTAAGSLYTSSAVQTKALPTSMAYSVEYANCQFYATGIIGVATGIYTTGINYRPLANSSRTSTTYNIGMEVIGRWKA